MDLTTVNLDNLDLVVRVISFKYKLCEIQSGKLKCYLRSRIQKGELFVTADVDFLAKNKEYEKKKLRVITE